MVENEVFVLFYVCCILVWIFLFLDIIHRPNHVQMLVFHVVSYTQDIASLSCTFPF